MCEFSSPALNQLLGHASCYNWEHNELNQLFLKLLLFCFTNIVFNKEGGIPCILTYGTFYL